MKMHVEKEYHCLRLDSPVDFFLFFAEVWGVTKYKSVNAPLM